MQSNSVIYISPIGALKITADDTAITELLFMDEVEKGTKTQHPILKECIYQLDEYFNGIRQEFGLPIRAEGTDYQQKVWEHLQKIPFGRTTTYLEIAQLMGDANATRAVGNAIGSNPIVILIPCHRVIGINGKLTGYSGGLKRKEALLLLEKSSIFGKQTSLF